MKLIFLHGLPGVGKLTVAEALAKVTGFPVFHNHLTVDLVGSVFEFGSAPFVALRESIWLSVFARAASEKIPGLIFTFVFESTVGSGFADAVVRLVESEGGEVLFVELTCDLAELEKRLVNPSRAAFGKLRSVETFRALRERDVFQTPDIPERNLVVDTTAKTAGETAQFIVEQLAL